MEDSPLSVDKWLIAMWMIVNDRNGISSYEIGRSLEITQKRAWFMAHRIRHAMTAGSLEKLDGEVEGTFNLFKRCVRGTWVAISPTHTRRYSAEQDTRYNVRNLKDGQRAAIVGGMVGGRRMTYARLTARRGGRGPQKGFDWRR